MPLSMEDLAEQIVGELALPEEAQTQPRWEQLDDRRYRISGRVSIRDWAEQFQVHRLSERVTTLAGLVVARLGRLPVEGDSIRIGNLSLTVESLRGRRIDWLVLELVNEEASSPPDETRKEEMS